MLKRLKVKVFITFGSLFVIALTVVGTINNHFSTNIIYEAIEKNSYSTIDNIEKIVDTAMEISVRNYLTAIAEKNNDIMSYYYEEYKKGNLTEKEAKSRVETIILAQKVGTSGYGWVYNFDQAPESIVCVIHPHVKGADIAKYDFAQKAFTQKNGIIEYKWKNPDEEEKRNKIMAVSFFEPWNWQIGFGSYKEEFMDLLEIETLKDKILASGINSGDYPYILNSDGVALIHPYMENENVYSLQDENGKYIIQEIIENKSGSLDYLWKNQEDQIVEKTVFYKHMEELDWYVCMSVDSNELFKDVRIQRNRQILIIIIFILIFSIITYLFSSLLTKSINAIRDSLKGISEGGGDLTQRINIKTKDELGETSDYFNTFMKSMNKIIANINDSYVKTSDIKNELFKKAKESNALTNSMSVETTDVASKMENLDEHIQEVSSAMEEVSSNLDSFNNRIDNQSSAVTQSTAAVEEMIASLDNVAKITEGKEKSSKQLIESTHVGGEKISSTAKKITDVNESVDSILNMASLISDIASQTNLLSMNAAIEAAHAGDAGRGFSVVAEEIRKLAEKASDSSTEISHGLKTIVTRISEAAANSEETSEFFENIRNEVTDMSKAFSEISGSTREIATGGQEILQAMSQLTDISQEVKTGSDEMKEGTSSVSNSMHTISEISSKVVLSVEKIDNSSEKVSEIIKKVEDYSEGLGDSMEKLGNEISRFKHE